MPASRVRQVTPYLEEVWEPVYGKTRSTDMVEILRASETLVGWKVTKRQTVSSQERARLSAEQFAEQLQSVQIQASDAFYDGHYPTVPGNDPVIVDGEVLTAEDGTVIRGGTMIRGRTEYNQKTKGMAHWDKGFVKERQKALAEEASRPVRNVKANLERVAGEVLPMRRFVANPRYDRKSAV